MPLFPRTAMSGAVPRTEEHHERAVESPLGARYRHSHGDPQEWSSNDFEDYYDLARAMPLPDFSPGGDPVTAAADHSESAAQHTHPIDVQDITATIGKTLDAMPLADTVDDLLTALRGHVRRLLPVVEAQDWASSDQQRIVQLLVGEIRKKLDSAPTVDGQVVAWCVYAQELARACRGLLGLALTEPGDDQWCQGGGSRMSCHARPRGSTWYDPVGDVCKWIYGLGVIATLVLLGQIVEQQHHAATAPVATVPDTPAEK